MKTDYKTVDIRTPAGLKKAEKLQEKGWKIATAGLYLIQFYKRKKEKENE
jgi:hypothetical protein